MSTWPQLDYLGWRETCFRSASLPADRRQIPAGPYAVAQPFLARDLLRHAARPDILAIPDGPGIEIVFDFREHVVARHLRRRARKRRSRSGR